LHIDSCLPFDVSNCRTCLTDCRVPSANERFSHFSPKTGPSHAFHITSLIALECTSDETRNLFSSLPSHILRNIIWVICRRVGVVKQPTHQDWCTGSLDVILFIIPSPLLSEHHCGEQNMQKRFGVTLITEKLLKNRRHQLGHVVALCIYLEISEVISRAFPVKELLFFTHHPVGRISSFMGD
jgi:hypothetical protein